MGPADRRKLVVRACLLALAVLMGPRAGVAQTIAPPASAEPSITLRLFIGNGQRLEIARLAVEGFLRANPGMAVEIETGGATIEQQQQALNAALAAKDGGFDLFLIDNLRAAQWAAAQWVEPLDAYLGAERDRLLERYPPALRAAAMAGGKVVALPYFADVQLLYFRKDLLEKYGLQPPATWDELKRAAQAIMAGENNPALRGFETSGAPVESTVCTFLVPLWGAGDDLVAGGRLNLAGEAAKRPFDLWADLREANVMPANHAEIATDRIRQSLQGGQLIFGLTWSYAWSRLENDPDSVVKGRIGIAAVPGFAPGSGAGCLGGWYVAVSSASRNKPEAVRFAQHFASPDVARIIAVQGGQLPVFPELYRDSEVMAARPWMAQALPALLSARLRPLTPRYSEVSEAIRTNMHAVLARTRTPEQALSDLNVRLGGILR
ncbi:MAG: ABC transporter substrate-binding protein [Methylobacterium sp.]|nr:MAG: ABC transporter substrate-binding protein [Methylobacterium sp.]